MSEATRMTIATRLQWKRQDLANLYEELRALPDGGGAAFRVSEAIEELDRAIRLCPSASPRKDNS